MKLLSTYLIILVKISFLYFFSSDYFDNLFYPFISDFIKTGLNPWNLYLGNWDPNLPSPFPYGSLMLFVLTPFVFIGNCLFGQGHYLAIFISKLSLLVFDILTYIILLKIIPSKKKEILIFYFLSPIILYANFIHSQLDLIPTALLIFSIYFLMKAKLWQSALLFGLSFSTKFHVIAALPILLIYIFKNYEKKFSIYYLLILLFPIFIFICPFLDSKGFQHFVLANEQQARAYDVYYRMGDLKLILPIFALTILYARFFSYQKINADLFLNFLGILFFVLISLIVPAPGWFIWILPFVTIFIAKQQKKNFNIYILFGLLNILILSYSIFFFRSNISDLKFLGTPISLKINSEFFKNITFTGMEATLSLFIFALYRYGILSNSIYKFQQPFVIGIAGDSSVGKTSLLNALKKLLSSDRVVELEGDGDHKWERGHDKWDELTHLNPKANFLHRQAEQILQLKSRDEILRTDYDHHTGKFTHPKRVRSKDFILISGLHTFYLPISRKALDLKIYLDTDEKLRQHWKIIRDSKERGYSIEKILEQINKRNEDAQKFIYPQKEFADIVFRLYSDDDFEIGNMDHRPKVSLEIRLDSSLNLEPLIDFLEKNKLQHSHDYEIDLSKQILNISNLTSIIDLKPILDESVLNKEEIISDGIEWSDGLTSIRNYILMLFISDRLRRRG
ncbi:MAG: hypothetical protein SH817_19055 [Leptospira sp.]|nr:hypothetical protein [Leptospira sp.]